MTDDQTNATLEASSVDLGPAKVIFSLDPKTLLFQTHKSEDVSALENRISLIEIHEILMEINLNLIPLLKVIQRTYAWYLGGLGVSSLLMLIMLVIQEIKLVKPMLCIFLIVNSWLLGILIARKKIYDRVIKRVLKDKEELYSSSGLTWVLKNAYFSLSHSKTCWLELKRNNPMEVYTTERNTHLEVDKNENDKENERYAEIYKHPKAPGNGTARRLQVASNFTLGPGGMSKNCSIRNTPQYTAIDVGIVESNRVRKQSH